MYVDDILLTCIVDQNVQSLLSLQKTLAELSH